MLFPNQNDVSGCSGKCFSCSTVMGKGENCEKYSRDFAANWRICTLAKPKYINNKVETITVSPYKRSIEMKRESKISTRLEQLAIPTARKLLESKREHVRKPFLHRNFHKHLRKSIFSMYSRLANTHLSEDKPTIKKWSKDEWHRHNFWLAKRALPKKLHRPEIIKSIVKPIDEERIEHLALPKFPRDKFYASQLPSCADPLIMIPRTALTYVPNEKFIALSKPSKPRKKFDPNAEPEMEEIEETIAPWKEMYPTPALYEHIEATALADLAQPRRVEPKFVKGDGKEMMQAVSKSALKYKASQSIQKLSEPKPYTKAEDGLLPISRSALQKLPKKKEEYYKKLSEPRKVG